jgi:hypothetical protein
MFAEPAQTNFFQSVIRFLWAAVVELLRFSRIDKIYFPSLQSNGLASCYLQMRKLTWGQCYESQNLGDNFLFSSERARYQVSSIWGRCYDHNFFANFANFRRKNGIFLKKNDSIIKFLQKVAECILSKKSANILQNVGAKKFLKSSHRSLVMSKRRYLCHKYIIYYNTDPLVPIFVINRLLAVKRGV